MAVTTPPAPPAPPPSALRRRLLAALHRVSYRQLLFVAFLLIALSMAAASLRGLLNLERLVAQSRAAAEQTVQVQGRLQAVAERAVTMERAARQYLVLEDAALRGRFEQARREALAELDALVAGPLPASAARAWRDEAARIAAMLDRGRTPERGAGDPELALAFRRLDAIGADIADRLRRETQARNQAQLDELERGRLALVRQMVGAALVAVMVAFAFGVLLARPLKRLEAAIVDLGENRLAEPIDIEGPADVRLLGQRLDWLRQRLAELDDDKARFLRQVSHELKTPLAALREGVALLEEGVTGTLNEPQREVARILRQNATRLQSQIEDLLRFNAAAFDARRLVRRPTELRGWIESLVDAQRLQWQAKRLAVRVAGARAVAPIDAEKLGTALSNLLSNAIRFSPHEGMVTIAYAQTPGATTIEVADEGPGVAIGDRAHVFEPFYRGERQPDDELRGSGIGLSIVREIVAAHGGSVELLPEGPGARFRIELPQARVR